MKCKSSVCSLCHIWSPACLSWSLLFLFLFFFLSYMAIFFSWARWQKYSGLHNKTHQNFPIWDHQWSGVFLTCLNWVFSSSLMGQDTHYLLVVFKKNLSRRRNPEETSRCSQVLIRAPNTIQMWLLRPTDFIWRRLLRPLLKYWTPPLYYILTSLLREKSKRRTKPPSSQSLRLDNGFWHE